MKFDYPFKIKVYLFDVVDIIPELKRFYSEYAANSKYRYSKLTLYNPTPLSKSAFYKAEIQDSTYSIVINDIELRPYQIDQLSELYTAS